MKNLKNSLKINNEKAEKAVRFVSCMKHTRGRWKGQNFNLYPWQEKILRDVFGTVNQEGKRKYRTLYLEVAKKNGKSEFAAAIALYLLFADDEPSAEIYSAACDRQQASIVFNNAASMVRQSKYLTKKCRVLDSVKRIVVPETESFYQVLSSDVKTKHGFNPHGVIFDELHAQPNRDLYDVLTQGAFAARDNSLLVIITTAGFGRDTIAREVHDYAVRVRDGIIKDDEFYPAIFAVGENEDWQNEKNWKKANPSIGHIFSIQSLRKEYKKAIEIPALENQFRRLRLNQWVEQETRFIAMDVWDNSSSGIIDTEMLKKKKCYAGLDLASTTDIAAFVMVFPSDDGRYRVLPHFFIPKENAQALEKKDKVPYSLWKKNGYVEFTEGNVIDYKTIRHRISRYAEKFVIKEIAYDRWGATQLVQELEEEGMTMIPFGQGFASMSAPTKELVNLLLAKKIEHGGNPVLRWMASNMVVKQDPAGNVKPDKAKSAQKIDGIVALIMALDRCIRHGAKEGSVYEKRGLRTLKV